MVLDNSGLKRNVNRRIREIKVLRKTKRRLLMALLMIIIVLLIIVTVFELYLSNNTLMYTEYIVNTSKISSQIRIVHLSDLHNREFENDNAELIEAVKKQNPDLICVTGDLLNKDEKNVDIATNLISNLAKDYPVYVSLGNHELEYKYTSSEELIRTLEKYGAIVLEFGYQDINIKGERIRIGGLYGYDLPETNDACREDETEFLSEFQKSEDYKLLLTHMPFGWYQAGSLDYWDVDLVLTGHTHGGQVRIPFIGGLYAPDIGWFPGKEEGLYYSENRDRVMVLSRGLGSTEKIPRFNNVPEIVVVDIIPE